MVVKQTKMDEISAYGRRGIQIFDDIEAQLKELIDETAQVVYNGKRARDFKTTCTQNAIDFNTVASGNMIEMAAVVKQASSFIAQNLGGEELDLEAPELKQITMPDLNVDDTIETADDEVLKGLQTSCTDVYQKVADLFDDHLDEFRALGSEESWIGPEYDSALGDIEILTSTMHTGIDESRDVMDRAISKQLQDLNMG